MSAPKRFFVREIGAETCLRGEEMRHAKTVLRLKTGDEVTLFDGSGREFTAIISEVGKNEIRLHTVGERVSEKDPKTRVYLLIGALKGDKTELVIQKATELGVYKIGVFSSRYCAAYLNENKINRFRRVAEEAAKQCLRSTVPEVVCFDDFPSAVASASEYDNKLFACEFIEKSETAPEEVAGECALIVGSEGGFTREEFEGAREAGFRGVTLGRRILRAETAAISLLSVVMYFLGELK